mmetsp:Transcript_8792/g.17956  ORF Transcript_8792/g.17956 Transcript_8792/m.17956 type:complete len:127 (+) Transcript_8792:292-672(+)
MPQSTSWLVLSLALATTAGTSAFTPTFLPPNGVIGYSSGSPAQRSRENRRLPSMAATASTDDEDCGCGGAVVSGRPSDTAKTLDPRVAIGKSTFLTLDGEETSMNQLLGEPSNSGTSLVVFLRSLG